MSVIVVSTGGTIASKADTGGDAAPELSGDDLVSAVPGLAETADVETRDFSNVPSPHFTIADMAELVALLAELDDDPAVEGTVVTQGTDILEESAYFTDLCYGGSTPVVFTGAMRNPSLPSPDGPRNLVTAVRTAVSPGARGGVFVAFNDRIHEAREVTKTHTMNVDTFRSPEFGPVAVADEDRILWRRDVVDRTGDLDVDVDRLSADVHAVTVTADMPPAQIRAASGSDGLCIAATGAGHIPPGIIPPLRELGEEGVPLVATSRCPEGRLARDTYEFPGSESTLQELECYYSDLNLQKTRIGTIVGLAASGVDELFSRPYT